MSIPFSNFFSFFCIFFDCPLPPPAVCKTGGKIILELIEICCSECRVNFCVCRSCYRGQRYCCRICHIKGYRRGHREAQKRYRRKEKGKMRHRLAEKKRRWRLWEKTREKIPMALITLTENEYQKISSKKTMDLVTATVTSASVSEKQWRSPMAHCHFCGSQGVIVKKFPRRGYGRYKK